MRAVTLAALAVCAVVVAGAAAASHICNSEKQRESCSQFVEAFKDGFLEAFKEEGLKHVSAPSSREPRPPDAKRPPRIIARDKKESQK
jgi:hypothetical protein